MKRNFVTALTMTTKWRRDMMKQLGAPASLRYPCIEEFVLFNAPLRESNIFDTPLPAMTQGNCFRNALNLVLDNPSYTYCEGLATMACSATMIPAQHGWVEDEMGMIHDPTWKDVIESQAPQHAHVREAADAIYCGVRVPRRAMMIHALFHRTVNVLVFDEMMNPMILRDGVGYFQNLLNGTTGDLFEGIGLPPSLQAKIDKVAALAKLTDEELEMRVRDMVDNHPSWIRTDDGYVLEGTEETWHP